MLEQLEKEVNNAARNTMAGNWSKLRRHTCANLFGYTPKYLGVYETINREGECGNW